MYKYKLYFGIISLQETEIDVLKSVKHALIQYSSMLRFMKCVNNLEVFFHSPLLKHCVNVRVFTYLLFFLICKLIN